MCGASFVDSKEPWSDAEEEPVDQRTPLLLDLRALLPLTIDPVCVKPEAVPLNAA